jgi:alginate O-acetyltransferase complex protein AlgI
MILFGLWHKASVLFVLWGAYHGVLLVLHRQIQQVQRKFDWSPPALWTPISWAATISLISLGWIFFRANTLLQARQMMSAVLSPASYVAHFLSGSLYLLILTLALGYAAVVLVIESLNRYSIQPQPTSEVSHRGCIALMAHWRWFWIPPLYVLVSLLLLIVTLTQNASTAQFMYRNF